MLSHADQRNLINIYTSGNNSQSNARPIRLVDLLGQGSMMRIVQPNLITVQVEITLGDELKLLAIDSVAITSAQALNIRKVIAYGYHTNRESQTGTMHHSIS